MNKDSDQATVGFINNGYDEVTSFQSELYISLFEAVWCIFTFFIHGPVIHHDVHLEDGRRNILKPRKYEGAFRKPERNQSDSFFSPCETDAFTKSFLGNTIPSFCTSV